MMIRGIAGLAVAASVAACDPCSGVVGCGTRHVAYEGRIVDTATGEPAAGVAVTLVAPPGVDGLPETLTVHTAADGRFQLELPSVRDSVVVEFLVQTSAGDGYRVPPTVLRATSGGGLLRLPVWTARPFVTVVPQFLLRADSRPAADAEVTFVRTGGVGVTPDSLQARTNEHGHIWLVATPDSMGTVLGRFTLRLPGVDRSFETVEIEIPTLHHHGETSGAIWSIGPVAHYYGTVRSPSGQPLAGVDVTLRHAGGLPLSRPVWEVTSNEEGEFLIFAALDDPFTNGTIEIDLEFEPPAPLPSFRGTATLETFESEDRRSAGEWTVPAS